MVSGHSSRDMGVLWNDGLQRMGVAPRVKAVVSLRRAGCDVGSYSYVFLRHVLWC